MNKGDAGYVKAVIDQKQYDLTFAQQDFVKKNCDKLPLVELLQKTFKEPSLNERSIEYDQLRKYIAKVKRDITKIEFTEDQINFMESNAADMRPLEMAQNIFPDKNITAPLAAEVKLIASYLKAIGAPGADDRNEESYRSPKASVSLVKKINQSDPSANYNPNDLTPHQKKCVEMLRSYLQSVRFASFMNLCTETEMKNMFEEEFVKGVYDKPDLNSEELNMYINLAFEYINIHQLTKSKLILEDKINLTLASSGDGDKGKNLYMSWVELLEKREGDLHKSKVRVEKLQINLSNSRAKRMEGMAQINESLTKFVEAWKMEEGRKRALRVAEARNKIVAKEIDRIEEMDEYIANVLGIGKDEILKN